MSRVLLRKMASARGRTEKIRSWAIVRNPGLAEQELWRAQNVEMHDVDLDAFVTELENAPVTEPMREPDSPYVGLAPFEAEHADYFFGRSVDSSVLADNVLARPITVLYGASGVGKSSVLNVGLPKALSELGVTARIASRSKWYEPAYSPSGWTKRRTPRRWHPHNRLSSSSISSRSTFLYADADQIKAFARSLAKFVTRTDLETHLSSLFATTDCIASMRYD